VSPTDRGDAFKERIQRHVEMYRASDGAEGGSMGGNSRVLLLTTRGRKSGREHTVPLTFFDANGTPVIVASNGGLESHPQWFLNLKENPNVRLKVFADEYDAIAAEADSETRAALWPQVTAVYPGYQKYQDGIQRQIPLVLLTRAA
jgi:proline iminopeptidase